MREGVLPAALLCGALGLAMAFAPRRAWVPGVVAASITTIVTALMPVPRGWLEGVFLGCWTSVAVSAATVHSPRGVGLSGGLALSVNAGLWCGAVIAVCGSLQDIAKALPCLLLLLPAAALRCRAPIVVKVVSSWLIAVALLAATLQFLPVTPGYLPDHTE